VRPLRESLAEGDVLAGHLIDQDDEVVRPQTGLLHDEPVERGEQREALLLRATGDEGQFEENEAIAVFAANKGRRVDELSLRKDVRWCRAIRPLTRQRRCGRSGLDCRIARRS